MGQTMRHVLARLSKYFYCEVVLICSLLSRCSSQFISTGGNAEDADSPFYPLGNVILPRISEEEEEAAAMAANCKALSRLISVYAAVAHCIEKEGKEGAKAKRGKLTSPLPHFFSIPPCNSTWLLAAFSPVCLFLCLSVHPLSSSLFAPTKFRLVSPPLPPREDPQEGLPGSNASGVRGPYCYFLAPSTSLPPMGEYRERRCIVCDI